MSRIKRICESGISFRLRGRARFDFIPGGRQFRAADQDLTPFAGDHGADSKTIKERSGKLWGAISEGVFGNCDRKRSRTLQTGGITCDRKNEVFEYHRSEG